MDTLAIVIINVQMDGYLVKSGSKKSGRKGIGKMNRSQISARTIRIFHLFFSLQRIIFL